MKINYLIAILCLFAIPCIAAAESIEVGTGVNTASVYIEWSDGFSTDFMVHFGIETNDTTTGLDLIDIIEAETELATERSGGFIQTISYQEHIDITPDDYADWWNYWVNNAGSKNPWEWSMELAGNRIVANGDTDAWVFGSGGNLPNVDLLEVGTGINQASVYIEWADGFTAEFLVNYGTSETETTTGLGLLDIIETETDLTTLRDDHGWGEFITTITYQGHSDINPSDWSAYWGYWINNAGSRYPWESSMLGALDRIVSHGDADCWIFGGYDPEYKPVPASENPFLEGYGQYVFDANDFATAWFAYEPNGTIGKDWLSGLPFDDPTSALGRPTVDTTGDDWYIPEDMNVPVVPVNPSFRSHELVMLGREGSITLEFNHQVSDDTLNPYGIDFIVFGNAFQSIGSGGGWSNDDPLAITVGSSGTIEPGIVSVSQDGITWYSFTNDPNFMKDDPNFIILDPNSQDGPFCDGFAPTLGRVYDPCYAYTEIGEWNEWWAEATNPTLPLNPDLSYQSFEGMSVARIAQTYGDSAGGTGYDLESLDLPVDPNTGLKWFQYIRIDDKKDGSTAEIDAVADVSCPGDYNHPAPTGDMNGDYRVDDEDVAIAESFLGQEITSPEDAAAAADLNNDGIVDQTDIDTITANIGSCSWGKITVTE